MEDANANINELYKQFLAVEELLSSSKGRYGAPEDGKLYDPALVAKETNLEEVQKNVKGARFVLNATLQNKLAKSGKF